MGLGAEVVHLDGLHLAEQAGQHVRARQVGVMQEQPRTGLMGFDVDVVDPGSVDGAGSPYEPVNLVALAQEKLGHVRPVLTGYARDEGPSCHWFLSHLPKVAPKHGIIQPLRLLERRQAVARGVSILPRTRRTTGGHHGDEQADRRNRDDRQRLRGGLSHRGVQASHRGGGPPGRGSTAPGRRVAATSQRSTVTRRSTPA